MHTILQKIIFTTIFTIGLSFTATILAASPEKIIGIPVIDDPSKPIMLTPLEAKWKPALSMLPTGAEMSVLEGDPEKPAPFTIRLKLPANYTIPTHWHPYDEHITVISGQLNIGLGDRLDLTKGKAHIAGSYARIPAKMHLFIWTAQETIIQLHGIGPWGLVYVDKNTAPISDETNKEERIQATGIREG